MKQSCPGFVDKFVALFALRRKLEAVRGDIQIAEEEKEAVCLWLWHGKRKSMCTLKLIMNKDYLFFMKITFFNEVIKKIIH